MKKWGWRDSNGGKLLDFAPGFDSQFSLWSPFFHEVMSECKAECGLKTNKKCSRKEIFPINGERDNG